MAVGFPCPNPSCYHLFRLEDIQGLATISCPKCKKIFSMRQGSAPKPTTKPLVTPVPSQPAQNSTSPALPSQKSITTNAPGETRRKKKPFISPFQWLFLLFGLLVIGLNIVLFFKLGMPFFKKEVNPPQNQPTLNNLLEGSFFKMTLPKNYTQDPDLAKKSKTQIALVVPKKSFFLYINKDFKTRQPTDAEGNLEMLSRLEGLFTKKLEWEPGDDTATLGGVPARTFRFEGEMDDQVFWTGKCLISSHHGVLFLMIQASTLDFAESSDSSWNQFLKTFQVRKDARPNWEPTPRKLKTMAITELDSRIQVPDEVWIQQNTEGYPLKPVAVFLGKNPSDVGNFGNQKAYLYCFANPKGSSEEKAWESPMNNLLQVLNEEPSESFKLEKLPKEQRNKKASAMVKSQFFQLQDQGTPIKSVELHHLTTPKGTLTLVVESPWKNKDYWSDEIGEILKLAGSGK